MGVHLRWIVLLFSALSVVRAGPAQGAQPGQAVMAWHVTIAPTWFDPSTAPPQITPFGMLYAIHDAMVRPLPGKRMAPSLAESWKESPDGKVTAEDVKFSYERYRGAGYREFEARVQAVEVVDAQTIRFHLKEPWAEFIYSRGTYANGGYPDIDDLFLQQAREREIQQLTIDRAMFGPIMDFRALMGVGPRVTDHTIAQIHNSPFPSYEDMRIKD